LNFKYISKHDRTNGETLDFVLRQETLTIKVFRINKFKKMWWQKKNEEEKWPC